MPKRLGDVSVISLFYKTPGRCECDVRHALFFVILSQIVSKHKILIRFVFGQFQDNRKLL